MSAPTTSGAADQRLLSPAAPDETRSSTRRKFLDAAVILAAAIVAALLLRTFVFEALRIPSGSMEPALLSGDVVIISKLPDARPIAGAVYAFHPPAGRADSGRNVVFVKRCIAVPGDTVTVSGGLVRINGKLQSRAEGKSSSSSIGPANLSGIRRIWIIPRRGEDVPLNDTTISLWQSLIDREGHQVTIGPRGDILLDGVPATSYRVRQSHCFVTGDNTADSYDSRYWGLLPESAIVGRAVLVYWSWDDARSAIRWGRIGMIVR